MRMALTRMAVPSSATPQVGAFFPEQMGGCVPRVLVGHFKSLGVLAPCPAHLLISPGAFHCVSGATCVGAGERCDGVPQCPDASDEAGCWSPTPDCALRCDAATRCVPESWLCDGHADCLDRADEQRCGKPPDGWHGVVWG